MPRDKPIRDKQDAHNAGQEDYKKCDGQSDPNPVNELTDSSHKPPRDDKGKYDSYKKGWKHAKKQRKKSR